MTDKQRELIEAVIAKTAELNRALSAAYGAGFSSNINTIEHDFSGPAIEVFSRLRAGYEEEVGRG